MLGLRAPAVAAATAGPSRARKASAGRWPSDCSPTARPWSTCPPSSSARVRVFDTGNARKTDPVDAHAVAMAALRTPKSDRCSTFDEELVALRLLADRRDELSALRVQTVNRLHRLFAELIPGGAPRKDLTATKAKTLLARVRPRDPGRQDHPADGRRRVGRPGPRRRQAQGPEPASSRPRSWPEART